MRTDLTQFESSFRGQIKALAENWEDAHVKIIGPTHPWVGQVGHVMRIDLMGGRPAMIVKLDNGIESAVFAGVDLKKI